MSRYAYRGNQSFISAVEERLAEASFKREGEIEEAEYMLTFCTNMTELEDLYFGEDGIVDRGLSNTVIIDLSPCTPNFAAELNAVVTLSDMKFIEAPMIIKDQVSPNAFDRANLSCFAAAEDGSLDIAREFLDAIFSRVDIVGGIGTAQLARACNTLQKVAEVVAAIESNALVEASRTSISSAETEGFHIKPTSPEALFVLKAIEDKHFDGSFTVEMLMGELSATIMTADDFETIIPQAEAAFHLLELLAVIGGAEKSPAALALVYGDQNEERCKKYGLDWSRAESLYDQADANDNAMSSDYLEEAIFGDGDDYFDYSSN